MAAWDTRIQCPCPQHLFHEGESTIVQNIEMPTTDQHSSPDLHLMKSPELNVKCELRHDLTLLHTCYCVTVKELSSTNLREAVCRAGLPWLLAQKPNRPQESFLPASDTFEEAGSIESTATWNLSQSPRGHKKYVHWIVWYSTYFFIIKWRQQNISSFSPLNKMKI